MSHGDSLIIGRSKLKAEYRDIFLSAKFFKEKPSIKNMEDWTTWFDPSKPSDDIQKTIIKFLDEEQYDYSEKVIEYWFQHQTSGQRLGPHCDYNHRVRSFQMDSGEWLHTTERGSVMSPITIGCYLEATDLVGGEFAICNHTWFDEPTPLILGEDVQKNILSSQIELIRPKQDEVLYFEGSKYYHWIEEVKRGERKSMMINFWPARYALS